jgi:hypothetical protein
MIFGATRMPYAPNYGACHVYARCWDSGFCCRSSLVV